MREEFAATLAGLPASCGTHYPGFRSLVTPLRHPSRRFSWPARQAWPGSSLRPPESGPSRRLRRFHRLHEYRWHAAYQERKSKRLNYSHYRSTRTCTLFPYPPRFRSSDGRKSTGGKSLQRLSPACPLPVGLITQAFEAWSPLCDILPGAFPGRPGRLGQVHLYGRPNQGLQGGFVDFIAFMNIDGTPRTKNGRANV